MLAAPVVVDTVPSGSTTLPTGIKVASHTILFDPINGSIDATVDFASDIVGLLLSTPRLAATDSLAHTGVSYLSPALRGLEIDDSVTISGPRQIRFRTNASTPGDYIRVLTASDSVAINLTGHTPESVPDLAPEPGTFTTISLVLALAALRYGRLLRSSRS